MLDTAISPSTRGDVDASHVRVAFGGITALEDVSVVVEPGQVVGIIGPNGAGKTTLFNVICGFLKPDSGTVSRGGSEFAPNPQRLASRGVARTMQGVGMCESLTVLENVMLGADNSRTGGVASSLLGARRQRRSEAALRERAQWALGEVGLLDRANRFPGEMPYPDQKRVALARAIASHPGLLMLDEPAGGLGAGDIEQLAAFIRGFVDDGERSVLLVEHHMDLVMGVCDRVFVLDFGRIVAQGSPAEIAQSPAVAEAYLGIAPDAETIIDPEVLS